MALWTPASITTAAWFDASDASTITSSGGAVSQWNDKSGNGRNATQGTGSEQPALVSAAQNGLDVLRFDGADDWFAFDFDWSAGSNHTAIMMLKTTPANSNIYGTRGTGGSYNQRVHVGFNSSTQYRMNFWYHDWYGTIGAFNSGAWNTLAYRWEVGVSRSIFANGTAEGSTTSADALGVPNGGGAIGHPIYGSRPALNGDIGEIVFFPDAVSTADRQKTEGYLAWKWGTEGSLPAAHPYKSAAPTQIGITSITPATGPGATPTSVTIAGTDFDVSTPTVTIDGEPCTSVSVASAISLTCNTPLSFTAGAKDVVATNSTGTATLAGGFTYAAPLQDRQQVGSVFQDWRRAEAVEGLGSVFTEWRRSETVDTIGSVFQDWRRSETVDSIGSVMAVPALPSTVLWTPADITTAAWFDASDASTITESGGAVSQWNDKSGQDEHFVQATASKKPTTGSRTLNSLNVLDMDGGDDMLASAFVLTNLHSIFAVASADSNGYRRILNGFVDEYYYFGTEQSTKNYATFYGAGSSWYDTDDNVPNSSIASAQVMGVTSDGSNATPYFNGVAMSTKSSNMGGSAPAGLQLGAKDGLIHPWDGVIAEIVIMTSVASTADRQKIEGYLAWRWGLQASLPAGHPYEGGAPRGTDPNPTKHYFEGPLTTPAPKITWF